VSARDDGDQVTPLDLLFDLVLVFGVLQLSHHLQSHLTWPGALETAILLVAVFAIWLQTTWTVLFLGQAGRERPQLQLAVLLLALFINASIGSAFGPQAWVFVGLYLAINVGRNVLVVSSPLRPYIIDHFQRMLVWLAVSSIGWLAGAADADRRLAWWAAAAAVDLAGIVTAHPLPWRRLHSEHQPIPRDRIFERARLFFIVALGETILSTGLAIAEHLDDPLTYLTGTVALLTTVAIWWTYFDTREAATRAGLQASTDPTRYSVGTFNVLFATVAAMIVIATGDALVIAQPRGQTDLPLMLVLFTGPALYLGVQAAWARAQRSVAVGARVIGLAVLMLLAVVSLAVPPFAAAIFALAPLVGVAVSDGRSHMLDRSG
jgi:low temperature requirement protein LtrA